MDIRWFTEKKFFLLIAATALFSVLYYGMGSEGMRGVSSGGDTSAPREGRPAPDFTLPDLEGTPVHLARLKGDVVFLNFWATWCGPCRWELPSMERVFRSYKDKKFHMLAVNVDDLDPEKVKRWVQREGLTFTILKDGDDLSVSQAYRTYSIPATFIIDKSGKIVEVVRGARTWDKKDFRTMLDSLVNESYAGEKPTSSSLGCKTC